MTLTATLTPNRSNPGRYVATLTYERKGDRVTPVRRVFDGPNHVQSVKVIPWNHPCLGNKDWSTAYTGKKGDGQKGRHSRPYTIKRDWLQLHQELELIRENPEAE